MAAISVIIPAYNAASTILETIDSVQKQTFSDLEIIVINDGSTDDLLAKLSTINDARLKVFSYRNGGLPTARNRGITHATGEYIAFLDADDLWTPDKLEFQLAALQAHPKAGLSYSWTYYMDEQGQSFHIAQPIWFEGNVYGNLLVQNFLAHGSNPLVRRATIDSVGEFNPTLRSAEDWDYWLRMAPDWEFVLVPKAQIFYRQSSQAMSTKVDVMEQSQLEVLESAYQRAPVELQYLKNQGFSRVYQYSAQLYLTRTTSANNVRQAAQKLWKSIQLYPPILGQQKTQKLIFKLLLMVILPTRYSKVILEWVSQSKAKSRQASADSYNTSSSM